MKYFEKQSGENWDYFKSVTRHKYDTYKAMRELGLPFWQSVGHDMDKYNPLLFVPYRDFFYGKGGVQGTNDPIVKERFYAAAQVHRLRNPHHYYSTRIPDQDLKNSKIEAIADWYAASKRRENYPENFPTFKQWWDQHKAGYRKKIGLPTYLEVDRRLEKKSSITAADAIAGLLSGVMVGHLTGDMVERNKEHLGQKATYKKGFLVGAPIGTAAGILVSKNLDKIKAIKIKL
jgi:hypothetical protein